MAFITLIATNEITPFMMTGTLHSNFFEIAGIKVETLDNVHEPNINENDNSEIYRGTTIWIINEVFLTLIKVNKTQDAKCLPIWVRSKFISSSF